MTLCNQQTLEPLHVTGRSKVSFRRAFARAYRGLQSEGGMACVGGQCTGGATCSFYLKSLDVAYTTDITGNGTLTYVVTMDGEGECHCD